MALRPSISFACGQLRLEGMLHLPDAVGPHPVALLCHPHPLYGGNMHNNVVTALAATLPRHGWAAFRFNFRGVGNSQGQYGGGEREREDVLSALDYLCTLPAVDQRLGVVGYSFGSWVGLAAGATDRRVKALVAISPPLSSYDFSSLAGCGKPISFLYGSRDDLVDPDAISPLSALLTNFSQRAFAGVDHFWLGRDTDLAEAVADFLAENVP